ncbi:tyrosinase family oxidase copper chaperone [Streptomyces sp. NPDC007189]|uniref:tyrosinase family oxidase copper chaperone n=2 Tax=unclassified Streptomyces TaxID=2593676 RepID=UPI003451AE5B
MGVGGGTVAVDTEQRGRAEAAGPSRRDMARRLLGSAAALAVAPLVAAARPAPSAKSPARAFDETYRGRHIQGVPVSAASRELGGQDWRITVDGRPLHLMRRADGTWMSMVDHYTSYRTPLEATRAAVDEIGPGQRLRDMASADADAGPMDCAMTGEAGTGSAEGDRGLRTGERDGVRA